MKSILVPTDFSQQAEKALLLAYQIARNNGSNIILLHVMEYPKTLQVDTVGAGAFSYLDNIHESLSQEALKKLEHIVTDPRFEVVTIIPQMENGNPFEGISQMVADQKVDLIVMGTKGASGIEEMLIGSNAEKVVRYAHCPVLTVSHEVDFSHLKEIVFATDLVDDQHYIVQELKKLQEIFGAALHIVRISTPSEFIYHDDFLRKAEKFVNKYKISNYHIHVFKCFKEAEGIIYYAEELNAGLIAIATHGRTGFARLARGSVAEKVVNHSTRPVWTCHLKA